MNQKNQMLLAGGLVLLIVIIAVSMIDSSHRRTDPASTQQASAPSKPLSEDYKKLTQYHNYYDTVKVMGKPDSEITTSRADGAVIPTVIMLYKSCNCAVILRYRADDDKEQTAYLGTKGFNPERVLDVAKDEYRELLDALKLSR